MRLYRRIREQEEEVREEDEGEEEMGKMDGASGELPYLTEGV